MAPSRREMINLSPIEDDRLRKRLVTVLGRKKNGKEDGDFVILDGDPDKPVKVVVGSSNDDELLIIAEKGQIACRDYPHARHLCARFPFSTYPHEKYCDKCHCYVCDTRAPCVHWGTGKSSGDHCHSTDKEEVWRVLRQSSKQCRTQSAASIQYATALSNAPPLHPAPSRSQPLNSGEEREVLSGSMLDRLSLQADRLTGKVKWFNSLRGYGFICPDGGGGDLFVHESSMKSEGYKRLTVGVVVEFQIGSEDDGRRKAIEVSVPARSFVRGSNRSTVQADRLTGKVKWFDSLRGYGFICPDVGGEDMFFHKSAVRYEGDLNVDEGQVVTYRIGRGEDRRKKAIAVRCKRSI